MSLNELRFPVAVPDAPMVDDIAALKFHPQASHIEPAYRDAWNGAIDAARSILQRQEAVKDAEIERLTDCLKGANSQAEEFERKWYLSVQNVEDKVVEIAALRHAVESLLPYVENIEDAGPEGEGWKSDKLCKVLVDAEAALAQVVQS